MIGYLTPNYPLVAAFRSLPKTRTRPADPVSQRIFKMAPKLSDYFRDGEFLSSKGDLERPISGLAMDSRRVMPGNLFFALPGRRADGSSFIDEAIQRGLATPSDTHMGSRGAWMARANHSLALPLSPSASSISPMSAQTRAGGRSAMCAVRAARATSRRRAARAALASAQAPSSESGVAPTRSRTRS